ncbi:MAG: mechanosensitive ion channel domain-containing protein [Promethearchaeota archaeon]
MAIFSTDLEALIYFIVIVVVLYLFNKLISSTVGKSKKIPLKQKIIINFGFKIVMAFIIVYFIIEGFPVISLIHPTYTAIITGAISTGIAFASSGIFTNFISGIVIMLVRPFEVDDLIKIEGDKGIVRAINLTKIKIENFDNIIIEKSNAQVLSSKVINYTVKLGKKKSFELFKNKILAPQDKGFKDLFGGTPESKKKFVNNLKQAYESFSGKHYPKLYNFTFRMAFPYKGFKIMMNKVEDLCNLYTEKGIFRIKPQFDIISFNINIIVKFRLMTFNAKKIFDFQPKFAQEVYKILRDNYLGI